MTNWLYGKKDRAAVCDLFRKHSDDDIEIQSKISGEWCPFVQANVISFSNTRRYRLKQLEVLDE